MTKSESLIVRVAVGAGVLLLAVGVVWLAHTVYVALFPAPQLHRSWLPMGLAIIGVSVVLVIGLGALVYGIFKLGMKRAERRRTEAGP